MTTFYSVLIAIDVMLAIGIITLVLLQHGKGADAGAAFGSGASATVFGARGSTSFLSRSTGVLAAFFFVNSLTLAYLAGHQPEDKSVLDNVAVQPTPKPQPSTKPMGEDVDVPTGEMMVPEQIGDSASSPVKQERGGSGGNVPLQNSAAPESNIKDTVQSKGGAKPEDVP